MLTMTGKGGQVRCGYQYAAALGAWTMEPRGPDFRVSGALASVDDFWITQEPLSLALPLGRTKWVWENVALTREGQGEFSVIVVGPPQIER
jgi:hypothetical protein